MNRVSIRDLRALVESGVAPCVTICFPTERTGKESLAEQLRLKNLVQQAEEVLSTSWMRAPEARKMMQAARDLPKEVADWNNGGQGLALFVDRNGLRSFRLPQPVPEFVHIGKRFRVKALIPFVDQGERFFILALSQNRTRLLEADRQAATEVELAGLPARLDDALQLDGADRGNQVHSGGDFGTGKQAAVFHGQGGQPDSRKEDLKLYFREVNKALSPTLRREQIPLVVVGVDYLLPIFRASCDYAGLMPDVVSGNVDYLTASEIHRHVWPAIEPHLDAPRQNAAIQLRELLGTGKASDNPRDVLVAAMEGRVATLFIDSRQDQWGVFDEGSKRVDVHGTFQPGDDDLLEMAMVETLRRGGEVYASDDLTLAGGETMAAVFRYGQT